MLGGDMGKTSQSRYARASPTCRRGLGKTCTRRSSVEENLQFFAPVRSWRRGNAASVSILTQAFIACSNSWALAVASWGA